VKGESKQKCGTGSLYPIKGVEPITVKGLIVAQLGYNEPMPENAVVRSRIRADVKEKATAVLQAMGLTVSDVMRIVLTRVAQEQALPFDLKPNKLTRETMRKTTRGIEIHKARNARDLFHKLGM
jgi:DNA-damage-inducible protein J